MVINRTDCGPFRLPH